MGFFGKIAGEVSHAIGSVFGGSDESESSPNSLPSTSISTPTVTLNSAPTQPPLLLNNDISIGQAVVTVTESLVHSSLTAPPKEEASSPPPSVLTVTTTKSSQHSKMVTATKSSKRSTMVTAAASSKHPPKFHASHHCNSTVTARPSDAGKQSSDSEKHEFPESSKDEGPNREGLLQNSSKPTTGQGSKHRRNNLASLKPRMASSTLMAIGSMTGSAIQPSSSLYLGASSVPTVSAVQYANSNTNQISASWGNPPAMTLAPRVDNALDAMAAPATYTTCVSGQACFGTNGTLVTSFSIPSSSGTASRATPAAVTTPALTTGTPAASASMILTSGIEEHDLGPAAGLGDDPVYTNTTYGATAFGTPMVPTSTTPGVLVQAHGPDTPYPVTPPETASHGDVPGHPWAMTTASSGLAYPTSAFGMHVAGSTGAFTTTAASVYPRASIFARSPSGTAQQTGYKHKRRQVQDSETSISFSPSGSPTTTSGASKAPRVTEIRTLETITVASSMLRRKASDPISNPATAGPHTMLDPNVTSTQTQAGAPMTAGPTVPATITRRATASGGSVSIGRNKVKRTKSGSHDANPKPKPKGSKPSGTMAKNNDKTAGSKNPKIGTSKGDKIRDFPDVILDLNDQDMATIGLPLEEQPGRQGQKSLAKKPGGKAKKPQAQSGGAQGSAKQKSQQAGTSGGGVQVSDKSSLAPGQNGSKQPDNNGKRPLPESSGAEQPVGPGSQSSQEPPGNKKPKSHKDVPRSVDVDWMKPARVPGKVNGILKRADDPDNPDNIQWPSRDEKSPALRGGTRGGQSGGRSGEGSGPSGGRGDPGSNRQSSGDSGGQSSSSRRRRRRRRSRDRLREALGIARPQPEIRPLDQPAPRHDSDRPTNYGDHIRDTMLDFTAESPEYSRLQVTPPADWPEQAIQNQRENSPRLPSYATSQSGNRNGGQNAPVDPEAQGRGQVGDQRSGQDPEVPDYGRSSLGRPLPAPGSGAYPQGGYGASSESDDEGTTGGQGSRGPRSGAPSGYDNQRAALRQSSRGSRPGPSSGYDNQRAVPQSPRRPRPPADSSGRTTGSRRRRRSLERRAPLDEQVEPSGSSDLVVDDGKDYCEEVAPQTPVRYSRLLVRRGGEQSKCKKKNKKNKSKNKNKNKNKSKQGAQQPYDPIREPESPTGAGAPVTHPASGVGGGDTYPRPGPGAPRREPQRYRSDDQPEASGSRPKQPQPKPQQEPEGRPSTPKAPPKDKEPQDYGLDSWSDLPPDKLEKQAKNEYLRQKYPDYSSEEEYPPPRPPSIPSVGSGEDPLTGDRLSQKGPFYEKPGKISPESPSDTSGRESPSDDSLSGGDGDDDSREGVAAGGQAGAGQGSRGSRGGGSRGGGGGNGSGRT